MLVVVWAGSSALGGLQRSTVGNFFTTELAGPGSYETELGPGTYGFVLFDLEQADISVTADGQNVPLTFRFEALSLEQSNGSGWAVSTTVEGERVLELVVDNTATYEVTLNSDGTVFSDSFEGANGAVSTGGNPFSDTGISEAIDGSLLPLLAGLAAILLGIIGSFRAVRAKRLHKSHLAYQERQAKRRQRQGDPNTT